jgi:gamma-glutamylcyclotransferase (GGCT)/AIG2-like uncharacterized protein YtfP
MTRPLAALFTYGTLRPGQPNFPSIATTPLGRSRAGWITNHVLYGQGLPFPYAAPSPGTVIGHLVWFPDRSAEEPTTLAQRP